VRKQSENDRPMTLDELDVVMECLADDGVQAILAMSDREVRNYLADRGPIVREREVRSRWDTTFLGAIVANIRGWIAAMRANVETNIATRFGQPLAANMGPMLIARALPALGLLLAATAVILMLWGSNSNGPSTTIVEVPPATSPDGPKIRQASVRSDHRWLFADDLCGPAWADLSRSQLRVDRALMKDEADDRKLQFAGVGLSFKIGDNDLETRVKDGVHVNTYDIAIADFEAGLRVYFEFSPEGDPRSGGQSAPPHKPEFIFALRRSGTNSLGSISEPERTLVSARVRDPSGVDIGEVRSVAVGPDGKVASVNVTVGGRTIALKADSLSYAAADNALTSVQSKAEITLSIDPQN
jgi:hypothetical protein